MKVEGIDAGVTAVRAPKQMKPEKTVSEAETAIADTVEPPKTKEHGGGVINLLQQGHFKGVADVRLRINFLDKIQSLENEQLKNSAETELQTFNQSIEEPIILLKDSPELSDDQRDAINQLLDNIKGIQDGFLEGDEFSIDDLISNLQGEFDILLPLFAPVTPEPPAEPQEIDPQPEIGEVTAAEELAFLAAKPPESELTEQVSVPGPVEETPAPESTEGVTASEETEPAREDGLAEIFTSFQELFQQAMADLQASLTEAQGTEVLPPISEPSGNGKAFEKFMAIYETMKNGAPDETLLINELEAAEQFL